MNTDKVLALAREAEMCNSHMAPGYLLANVEQLQLFAALIQQQMEAEGWRSPEVMQPSPFLRPPKFGQCLICGANHGGLACPDSNVTSGSANDKG